MFYLLRASVSSIAKRWLCNMTDKEKGYVTYDDVRMKLHGAYVTYKGTLYFAMAESKQQPGGNNHLVHLYRPKDRSRDATSKADPFVVDYRSDDVDISSIPLGYVNHNGKAHYLERHPFRKNAQGASPSNIVNAGDYNVFYSDSMDVLINNNYPSFMDALSKIEEDEVESIAFSRIFALKRNDLNKRLVEVLLRKRPIGFVMGKSISLYESPERSFIVKKLTQAGVEL